MDFVGIQKQTPTTVNGNIYMNNKNSSPKKKLKSLFHQGLWQGFRIQSLKEMFFTSCQIIDLRLDMIQIMRDLIMWVCKKIDVLFRKIVYCIDISNWHKWWYFPWLRLGIDSSPTQDIKGLSDWYWNFLLKGIIYDFISASLPKTRRREIAKTIVNFSGEQAHSRHTIETMIVVYRVPWTSQYAILCHQRYKFGCRCGCINHADHPRFSQMHCCTVCWANHAIHPQYPSTFWELCQKLFIWIVDL